MKLWNTLDRDRDMQEEQERSGMSVLLFYMHIASQKSTLVN